MDLSNIILIGISITFLIIIILLIIYIAYLNSNMIYPLECPKVEGVYAVNPNTLVTLYEDYKVSSIEDAMFKCDILSDKCNSFIYNNSTNRMMTCKPSKDGTAYTTYTKQYNYTYINK